MKRSCSFRIEDAYIVCVCVFLSPFPSACVPIAIFHNPIGNALNRNWYAIICVWHASMLRYACMNKKILLRRRKNGEAFVACKISHCHHSGKRFIFHTKNRFCRCEKSWCSHISKRMEQFLEYVHVFNPILGWNIGAAEAKNSDLYLTWHLESLSLICSEIEHHQNLQLHDIFCFS